MVWLALLPVANAGPARAALKTTAVFPVKVLAPGEPVYLDLRLKNRTRDVLYFPDFTSDACWLEKYATLTLDPPREPVMPKPAECAAEATRVPPDDTFHRRINLSALYGLPPETLHAVQVAWLNGGADVYSPTSLRAGPVKFKAPFHTGRLLPGDTLFLSDKSSLEFVKFVPQAPLERGADPMLELQMIHRTPGAGEVEKTFKFAHKLVKQFEYAGYTFHVPNHQYGQWIEVRVFEP